MRTWIVEVTNPPMTGAAIGFITSVPTPVDHIIGTRPIIVVPTVINYRLGTDQAHAGKDSWDDCRKAKPMHDSFEELEKNNNQG